MEAKVTVEDALAVLEEQGYVLWKAPATSGRRIKLPVQRFTGDVHRFGLVADTHLGSKWQQLTYLRAFYLHCARKKISTVIHAGDLVDGERVYRGHRYELFMLGADAQADYAVDHYPRYKGITTYVISGNHDSSFQQQVGMDVVKRICSQREDMNYLGYAGATVEIAGVPVYVMHCDGGVPYARSYRLQKIIEQFPGGQKPRILVAGHLHVTDVLPNYRNVMGILAGCFQSQTPYLRRKGLAPDIGGSIIEFTIGSGDDGIVSLKYEWVPFYHAVSDDY